MDRLSRHDKSERKIISFEDKRRELRFKASRLPSRQSERLAVLKTWRMARKLQQGGKQGTVWHFITAPLRMAFTMGKVVILAGVHVFQWVLRFAYVLMFLIGAALIGIGLIMALLSAGKVPSGYWDSLWNVVRVFGFSAVVGFILDMILWLFQFRLLKNLFQTGKFRKGKHAKTVQKRAY